MSELDEFDKMGDFSGEQWQDLYETSDREQAKMRGGDGETKDQCSKDTKKAKVGSKSLCNHPNTVVAFIRISRSIEKTTRLQGKDATEKRRLERLEKCGHVLTTPEEARQDVILLMNQMAYQKDKSFMVDRVIEVDDDKKLESQAFTIRRVTGRVPIKKPRMSDGKISESAVKATAMPSNTVKMEKEEIEDRIKEEQRCDTLRAVGPKMDVTIVTASDEKKVPIGKEVSLDSSSGVSIVVTPEKEKMHSKEPVLLDMVSQEQKKQTGYTAIVQKNDQRRISQPRKIVMLPRGLRKSTKEERTMKDYFDKLH
jgi:hypothetical protein